MAPLKLTDMDQVNLQNMYREGQSIESIAQAFKVHRNTIARHIAIPNRRAERSWEVFLKNVTDRGGVVLEDSWLGAATPHRVKCCMGHTVFPTPSNIKRRTTFCRLCAGRDPIVGKTRFLDLLEEHGATPQFSIWKGWLHSYRIRCSKGHITYPWACAVLRGCGVCRFCYVLHDCLYIVSHSVLPQFKFGITSGDTRPRLNDHRRNGYDKVILLVTKIKDDMASQTEKAICLALYEAGYKPIHGREYYDVSALPIALDIADGWLLSSKNRLDSHDIASLSHTK